MTREARPALQWQSKLILLLVVPWTGIHGLLQSFFWFRQVPVVAWTTLGISGIFGLIVWRLRAGTLGAAATGAMITASLMYSTTQFPYATSWLHGGLMPLLAVFLLTFVATKIGHKKKERLGTGESRRGRNSAQVAANLGMAALVSIEASWSAVGLHPFSGLVQFVALSALAEAAADTVSSEIGQVFGGIPKMITTFKRVEPGIDGGITLAGTVAGIVAAAVVSTIGVSVLGGNPLEIVAFAAAATSAATFGLLFDSLLGATFERAAWLNNDAVNFLSTLSTAIIATILGIPLMVHFLVI